MGIYSFSYEYINLFVFLKKMLMWLGGLTCLKSVGYAIRLETQELMMQIEELFWGISSFTL